MKTNRLFITVAIIIAGSFFVNVSAQDALKAIAKKCETLENEDFSVNVVRTRNKDTKKVERYIMTIDFRNGPSAKKDAVKDNEPLKKEILAAFEKDRSNADHEMEERKNGKITTFSLRFGSSSYTFSESSSGRFSFSVIEDSGNKDGAFMKHGYGYYSDDIHPLMSQIDMRKQNIESIEEELSAPAEPVNDL